MISKIAETVRAELGGGAVRKAVATLVNDRFKSKIGPSDKRILTDFATFFTVRILWDVAPEEIVAFVDERQAGNNAETRERYISGLAAFLHLLIARGQYRALPDFIRDQEARNPDTRSRRPVQTFRIALLADVINAAHITIATPLHIQYVAGMRVSSPFRRSGIRRQRCREWRDGGSRATHALRNAQARPPASTPDNRARCASVAW